MSLLDFKRNLWKNRSHKSVYQFCAAFLTTNAI
jgi:hypothetical protein